MLTYAGESYEINPRMVRGLDYYTKTAFEIIASDIGAQSSIGGGGRYDGLVEECGGPSTPAVGFALGIERILLTMEKQGVEFSDRDSVDYYLVHGGEEAKKECFKLLNEIRSKGRSALMDFEDKSFRAQFKKADKLNASYSVIIGEDELKRGKILLRNMEDGKQEEFTSEEFIQVVS